MRGTAARPTASPLCSVATLFLALLAGFPAPAAGLERPDVTVPDGSSVERPRPDPALELVEEREAFYKVYRVADDPTQRIVEIAPSPLHYRGAGGRWLDVDTTLKARRGGKWEAKDNAFQTVVHERVSAKGSLAEVTFFGRTLSLGAQLGLVLRSSDGTERAVAERRDGARGRVEGGRVAYAAALGGELEFAVGAADLAQRLVLPSAPFYREDVRDEAGDVLVFRETMRLDSGLVPHLDDAPLRSGETRDGRVLTFHATKGEEKGQALFLAAPPFAYAADETGVVVDDQAVEGWYRVTRRGRALVVEKLFPAAWFVEESRQYPVVLDPTLQPTILMSNTWFHSGVVYKCTGCPGGEYERVVTYGSAHYGEYTGNRIRLYGNGASRIMNAWLRFDVSGLHRYITTVNWIHLLLYMDYAVSPTTINFNRVSLDVCSYDSSAYGPTLYSAIDTGTTYSTLAPGPLLNQWHTFDLCGTAPGALKADRSLNIGYFNVGMELTNVSGGRDIRFRDRQDPYRPRLIVNYTVGCTSAADCNDNIACTTNVCNEGRCEYPVAANYCLIGGTCYNNGQLNPGNACQSCSTSYSTGAWWTRTNYACNDGNACTHTDLCRSNATCSGTAYSCNDNKTCTADSCNGSGGCNHSLIAGNCLIGGTCYARYAQNPANPCQECRDYWSAFYQTNWAYDNANACNDGNVCTHTDRCSAGTCTGTGYSCDDGKTCTTDICNGSGGCTHNVVAGSCLIGSTCYSNNELHPSNACQSCKSAVDPNNWSNEPNGTHARSCFPCSGNPALGICHNGTQTCLSGSYGGCSGYQCPVGETCNNVDDDCDGGVDEGNPQGGASCNTMLAGSACDAGITECRDHALQCFPNVSGFGDPAAASVPAGLLDRSNGGIGNDYKMVTGNGRYMFNLAYSCGAGYNGYKIRKFELDAGGSNWVLRDEWNHCGVTSRYIDGVVATPRYLYAVEWTGGTGTVSRFDVVTHQYVENHGTMRQGSPYAFIHGQYDWVNNRVWMGSLYTGIVASWNLSGHDWTPTTANMTSLFTCGGITSVGVVGTDGTYLYGKRWGGYPGDDYLRRCGTGVQGTTAGAYYGRATNFATANGLSGFYHSDGYYYVGSYGSPYSIQRTRLTQSAVEDCDNNDDNCSGVADEVCDYDGDNRCDATLPIVGSPATCTAGGADCNDWASDVNPGVHEICDLTDHDCDGQIYEDYAAGCVPFWEDRDDDWYGAYAVLDEGPTGFWTMDDRWNDSVWDASGRGHHGTRVGGTTFSAGKVGDAADYHNGASDYIVVPDHAELRPTNRMTFEAWIYPRARPNGYATQIIHKATGTANATLAWYYFGSNGLLQPYSTISGTFGGCGGFVPPLNAWTHVALTFDGVRYKTYQNGNLVGDCFRPGVIASNTAPLTIGIGWQSPFNGMLDEVAFFRDALTQEKIRKHMALTAPHRYRCLCLGAETPPWTSIWGWDCNDVDATINPDASETCDGVDEDCDGLTDEGTDPLCADSYACTSDVCTSGACAHSILPANCLISGVCYSNGAENGQCQECRPGSSQTAWTYVTNKGCNDGNACTHTDVCAAGGVGCRGTTYSCNDNLTCTTDTCLGNGGCTHTTNAGTCLIGGVCYANGANNPANPCQWCVAATNNAGWTNKGSGAACPGDAYACTNDVCNGSGSCVHPIQGGKCLIGGACYDNGNNNPGNECARCWTATSQVTWTNKPSGMTCTNDGQACTTDVCNGAGSCTHPVNGGWCLIDAACYADGAASGQCEECEPSVNQHDWTYMSGKVCNDVDACTHTDRCVGGAGGSTALELAFDEGIGNLAGDGSGNANHGTLTGGTTWVSGHEQQAVSFDGLTGYVQVADAAELSPTQQITIALWVNPAAGINCDGANNWRYLVAKNGWGSYHLIFEENYSVGWTVRVNGGDQRLWTGGNIAPAGTWTHIAFTYNAATGAQRTYVNGALNTSRAGTTGTITPYAGTALRVGMWGGTVACPNGGGAYKGAVDDVVVFGRELSAGEIAALRTGGPGAPPCAGTAYSCDDSLSCTNDICLGNGTCSNPIVAGRCLIGGTCYLHNDTNPGNECQNCNTTVGNTVWTAKTNGTACTDEGLSCTADYCTTGTCTHNILSGRCLIGGVCYNRSQRNPAINCQHCWDPTTKVAWTNVPSGQTCTADAYGCTDDVCNGSGTCTHPIQADKCLIGSTCYNDKATRPGIECEWCDAPASHTAWTDKPTTQACSSDGLVCTSDYCNGAGTCGHTLNSGWCLIASRCYANQADNPANECAWCNTGVSTATWTNKPSGMSCTADAYGCTLDQCNGGGACTHPIIAGRCLIGGTCYNDGAPNGMCRECEPVASQTAWTYMTGKVCNDSNDCSHTDRCKAGGVDDAGCDGIDYSCDDHLTCTADSCLGDGTCRNRLINGNCLIGNVCFANHETNPGNECQWCDPAASTGGWTNKPSGVVCTADVYSCTNDICNGGGACVHPTQADKCLIANVCYNTGQDRPGNPCQECTPTTSQTGWTNVPLNTVSQQCYPCGVSAPGIGECDWGIQWCTNGSWGACASYTCPVAEGCNLKDDDCDGGTDEESDLGYTTCGLGECDHTIDNCVGGVTQVCNPLEGAVSERCDALDNDCDGRTDEVFSIIDWNGGTKYIGEACGTGACAGGTVVCTGDHLGAECSTWGSISSETCNGVDEDCDGQVDENTDSQCADAFNCTTDRCTSGACQSTIDNGRCLIAGTCWTDHDQKPDNPCQECSSALSKTAWSSVPPSTRSQPCWPCATGGDPDLGLCHWGTQWCQAGAWGACGGYQCAVADTCDAKDNDCDGQTDEVIPDDGIACTIDQCIGGVEQHPVQAGWCLIGGACYASGAINPGNGCEVCFPPADQRAWSDTILDAGFEGSLSGFTVVDLSGSGVKWQSDGARAFSGAKSLYFGKTATHDYAATTNRVRATATSAWMTLPNSVVDRLTFMLWLETEEFTATPDYDVLRLGIEPQGGPAVPLWNSTTALGGTTNGVFERVVVDLSPWAGRVARIIFEFDSGDGNFNAYEGAYLDDVQVETACCSNAADCDDGLACSVDSCAGGMCHYVNGCSTCIPRMRNVALDVDRSISMDDPPVPGPTDKWSILVQAMTNVLPSYEDLLNLSLNVYPVGGDCTVSTGLEQPFHSSGSEIADYLAATNPLGHDALSQSLFELGTVFGTTSLAGDPFVVLVTDGTEECGGDPVAATLNLHSLGVDTYVIGFGDAIDPVLLTEIAVAGGRPRPTPSTGDRAYWYAVDLNGLEAALEAVFDQVYGESCNNRDDDCDSATDENVPPIGCNFTCAGGLGGQKTCSAGVWSTCSAMPTAEVCDGLDNDCDGLTDADDPDLLDNDWPLCELQSGVCQGLRKPASLCVGGAWLACDADEYGPHAAANGQLYAADEGTVCGPDLCCDGADNDCDGGVDEAMGQTTCGLGHCEHTEQNCVDGVVNACDPLLGATPEVCDGIYDAVNDVTIPTDNDCDGVANEVPDACDWLGPPGDPPAGWTDEWDFRWFYQSCTDGDPYGAYALQPGEVPPCICAYSKPLLIWDCVGF